MSGKGQFVCGNKHCDEKNGLASYEGWQMVNGSFSNRKSCQLRYLEAGENKQALVKLVACNGCAQKLSYKRKKEDKERLTNSEKHQRMRERAQNCSDSEDSIERNIKKRKKGYRSAGAAEDEEEEENFDEFLREMFP